MNDKTHNHNEGLLSLKPHLYCVPSDWEPKGVDVTLYEDGCGSLFLVHDGRVYGDFMVMLGETTFAEDAAWIVADPTDASEWLMDGTIDDHGDQVMDAIAYYANGDVYYLNNLSGYNGRYYLGLNEDGSVDVEQSRE